MLARNPKTGGQIRVMKSDTSIWKDSKTLVWMKEPYCETMNRWKRFDILIAGTNNELLKWNPQIVILTEDNEASRLWLKTPQAKTTRFILVTMKLVAILAKESFDISQLGNVLCLEEYASVYPFLGSTWDGTIEDAIICASLVFRYDRLVGIKPGHPRMSLIGFDKVHLTLMENCKEPEPLVLIQQYYTPKDKLRADELYKCLRKNLECEYIDTIYLFMESKDAKLPPDPFKKLITIPLKTRITYADCIYLIQNKIGAEKIVVFANTDIYLDSTWRSIWSVNIHDTFLALLRWEEGIDGNEDTLFGPREDSQDTWVIHSSSVLSKTWDLNAINIPFGKAGCDNAICVEFLRKKFKIVNPASTLKTIHVHHSEIRNYDPKDIVDRPVYMFIEPSGIHELNPLLTWEGWAGDPIVYEPLERPLKSTNPKALAMFCSQMNRDPSFIWSSDGTNSYLPPSDQDRLIKMCGGAFVSPNGLVYKHSDICVGNTSIQKAAWSSNTLSHLLPAHGVNEMMAFPLEKEWVYDPGLYVLNYLSRVMKQRSETPEASFWCKKTEGHLSAIKLFKWNLSRGRLLEYDDETQVFSKNVYGRTAHGVKIMPGDIKALREAMLDGWVSEVNIDSFIVFVSDTLHIKEELLDNLQAYAKDQGLKVKIVSSHASAVQWSNALSGASRVVLSSSIKNLKVSTWSWMWLAPKGCKILELQEEREPSDSLIHLCAAAGLEWTLLQYPRSIPEGFKKIVLNEFKKWFILDAPAKHLPILYMPPRTMKFGFFGHKGDSFREIALAWGERGYVEIREDPSICNCWLNSVGAEGTLLYERPTWAWLEKSPEKEQVYKKCLVGNPDFTVKPLAQAWTFWPRQPRILEIAIEYASLEYNERSDNLVFFGRVENDEQGKWRKDVSGWEQICSKFWMPIGAKEPYVYSPEQYLKALALSKYGLCLRGYGPKCNREIELMAMGTVPIVVEGVDMDNYFEPPVEGVHYLRVNGPDDAVSKMAAMNQTQWELMSKACKQWWKENASIDGSWLLTKKLFDSKT